MSKENYKLLKRRRIYDILDGDEHFVSKIDGRELSMPYLSGPRIVQILNTIVPFLS